MTSEPHGSFTLQLDEAIAGWMLPMVGLAIALAIGGLYLAGWASEAATASTVVVTVGSGVALYVSRLALGARRRTSARLLAVAAALATFVAAVVPALISIRPGAPILAGELREEGASLSVPEGAAGSVRVLVSGRLAERGEPSVSYQLTGTREPVEGKLERTFSNVRVGRSGRARVAHDRTADLFPARLAPGAHQLKLAHLIGQPGSPLHVAVFRDPLPLAGAAWWLALAAVVLAALAEVRAGQAHDLSVTAGMAVVFGLLVAYHATPTVAVGPSIGAVVLGAILGALVGWLVGAMVRRLVPAP